MVFREYQIGKLQRIMNARFVSWERFVSCCHITPLLRELDWLPMRLRIDFKIIRITFKILQSLAPSYLVSILSASHYQLRRNGNGILLANPLFKTKRSMGDHDRAAFMVAAPILRNSLPLSVRQAKNVFSGGLLLRFNCKFNSRIYYRS